MALSAAALQAASGASPAQGPQTWLSLRDWNRYPAIIQTEAPAVFYAIGDIHGDYERLVRLLVGSRIIQAAPSAPESIAWAAGRSVLVVTGDMIDKGPRPASVLKALQALQAAARKGGGDVIVLAGNHEAELLGGAKKSDASQHEELAAELKESGQTLDRLAACEGDLGAFLCSLPIAARVGDWFFSHGGNTGGLGIAALSRAIQSGSYNLLDANSILEARANATGNWFDAPGGERPLLATDAAALGVKHMVQGHQHGAAHFQDGVKRAAGEMFQRWGLLFFIDVGMSRGVGDSTGAALRITSQDASAVCADGSQTLLWRANATSDVGRAAPCRK